MTSDRDRIRAYYATGGEYRRLHDDDGWFEFERTLSLIERTLPPPASILDLGAGPGRYTIALAQRGYRVTLMDLSPEHVEEAHKHIMNAGVGSSVDACLVGDAAHLETYPLPHFDAVLCAGPLYHVGSLDELAHVAQQVGRVTKPKGVIFAAFIPRATGVSGLIARAASHPDHTPPGTLTQAWDTGRFVNTAEDAFGEAFFAEPNDVQRAFEASGWITETLASLRGLAAPYGTALRQLKHHHPTLYDEVVTLVDQSAERPDIISMGWHALYIGRRDHRRTHTSE